MSVDFTESDTAKLQVLNSQVLKWLRECKEIKRLISSSGYSDGGPRLESIGIVLPGNKGHEIFAGSLHIDKKPWFFSLYGRKNQEVIQGIMRDLASDFEVNINIRLDDEYSHEPWKGGGCVAVIAAIVVITFAVIAVLI